MTDILKDEELDEASGGDKEKRECFLSPTGEHEWIVNHNRPWEYFCRYCLKSKS